MTSDAARRVWSPSNAVPPPPPARRSSVPPGPPDGAPSGPPPDAQSTGFASRLSLRTRVGALAALGVGLAVTLTALAAYLTVSSQLQSSVDQNLLDRARSAVSTTLGDPQQLADIPGAAIVATDVRIALLQANGTAVIARGVDTTPPMGDQELAVARGESRESVRTADLAGDSYRVVAVPGQPGFALVLGQPTAQTEQLLDRLRLVSFIAGGVGIVLATWAGLSIARAGLRPVRQLTQAAEHVAATGQLEPIEVTGSDEIARLAHAFNAMLAALSEARLRQSRLVADAGHELRTPLTSMRTNLDLLAQSEASGGLSDADRAQLIADTRAQAVELSTLVGDLVELSREDAPAASHEQVDVADVVRDALSRVRRRAPGVAFSADLRSWVVAGDATQLGRAATNLLDNAAKFSPPHGTVTVTLHDGVLDVCDEGPGIADEDLPRVFDRFYRSSEARGLPGSGLGLAIVKAAAERHGGSVEAGRAPSGGARLTMRLPAASSAALD
ncbi:HAMP domain-containing sensor histidine kinase [Jiangella sp. DSM 45060]|uniref:HAMP domain-containing sensor histidine kinase n=1 Tax=Jiangella sp. DSM 45060 TaxID=1798224 RepID=UPI00087A61E5|nr:HAMP domain-containing sensor histidine kinase [Jiangella sp. DSM 45060]SDS84197.1 two-component system, OmpR family, sensor histidine kinase MprB [Jiangella sp. DSM 45060]